MQNQTYTLDKIDQNRVSVIQKRLQKIEKNRMKTSMRDYEKLVSNKPNIDELSINVYRRKL